MYSRARSSPEPHRARERQALSRFNECHFSVKKQQRCNEHLLRNLRLRRLRRCRKGLPDALERVQTIVVDGEVGPKSTPQRFKRSRAGTHLDQGDLLKGPSRPGNVSHDLIEGDSMLGSAPETGLQVSRFSIDVQRDLRPKCVQLGELPNAGRNFRSASQCAIKPARHDGCFKNRLFDDALQIHGIQDAQFQDLAPTRLGAQSECDLILA